MDQQNDAVTPPEKSSDESTGVGRSYECTFCKRGFTNAQALGGHMNIHRKDKAKSKSKHKINQDQEPSNKANEIHHSNSRYASPTISSSDHDHHQSGYGGQLSYQLFLPSPNPNFQTGNYLPVWRPDRFEGRHDAGLSLRMGMEPPPSDRDGEEGRVDSNVKENEVDLELRLGHDP